MSETSQKQGTNRVGSTELVRRLEESYRLTAVRHFDHSDTLREVGMDMRRARETAGVSLRELARRMSCSAQLLSQMERGHRKLTVTWCKKALAEMAPAGMNHYCGGESGSGEWSCRSDVPSLCYYCKEPNAQVHPSEERGLGATPCFLPNDLKTMNAENE